MRKFEFVLYINGNIICQRFFLIKNFNKKSIKSLDIKESVNYIVSIIKEKLKKKCVDYLWSQYNPYIPQTEVQRIDIYEKEDVFDFTIKIDDRSVITERFTGNVYPQRVRYSVDIRDLIPEIIVEIQETLSKENFTVEYCETEL